MSHRRANTLSSTWVSTCVQIRNTLYVGEYREHIGFRDLDGLRCDFLPKRRQELRHQGGQAGHIGAVMITGKEGDTLDE